MSAVRYSRRVTRAEWYAAGGLENSRCWRRQRKGGAWQYFILKENAA
jgi:hypothetical protein